MIVPLVAGCFGGASSEPPKATYDAPGIAQAALASYDKNKNGQIEGAELDACPGLKLALPAIDKNNDKSLSTDEIKQRVEQYAAQGNAALTCTVTLDDKPLGEATVVFEPEACMGKSLKTATTTTDKDGVCGMFQAEGKTFGGLPPGLYRIRITKAGANIPARYNTQSTLGREVMADPRLGEAAILLELKSR